jgi:hypothetical protein
MLKNELSELSKKLLKPSACRLLTTEPVLRGLLNFLFELMDTHGQRTTKLNRPNTLKDRITKYASDMIRDVFRVRALFLLLLFKRFDLFSLNFNYNHRTLRLQERIFCRKSSNAFSPPSWTSRACSSISCAYLSSPSRPARFKISLPNSGAN